MTTSARSERLALCDLFDEVGPDAPTLCGDWTTRDLAAHLVVRERRPDAAIGIVASALASYGEKVRADQALAPFPDTVRTVRNGPPMWSPMRIGAVDALTNTVEYFVHHEDVRRGSEPWQPRELSAQLDGDLRKALGRMAKMMTRKAPCGIVISPDGGERIVAKSGEPSVLLRGPVGELVLFLFGRQAHSHVEIDGPDDLAEAVRTASFGI